MDVQWPAQLKPKVVSIALTYPCLLYWVVQGSPLLPRCWRRHAEGGEMGYASSFKGVQQIPAWRDCWDPGTKACQCSPWHRAAPCWFPALLCLEARSNHHNSRIIFVQAWHPCRNFLQCSECCWPSHGSTCCPGTPHHSCKSYWPF